MFYVYIIETDNGTYYTGQTNDLNRRLMEHMTQGSQSASYLRMNKPLFLVYLEEFDTRGEAMQREYELKKNKKLKYQLIEANERISIESFLSASE